MTMLYMCLLRYICIHAVCPLFSAFDTPARHSPIRAPHGAPVMSVQVRLPHSVEHGHAHRVRPRKNAASLQCSHSRCICNADCPPARRARPRSSVRLRTSVRACVSLFAFCRTWVPRRAHRHRAPMKTDAVATCSSIKTTFIRIIILARHHVHVRLVNSHLCVKSEAM